MKNIQVLVYQIVDISYDSLHFMYFSIRKDA
jgi:hypothetical protein